LSVGQGLTDPIVFNGANPTIGVPSSWLDGSQLYMGWSAGDYGTNGPSVALQLSAADLEAGNVVVVVTVETGAISYLRPNPGG